MTESTRNTYASCSLEILKRTVLEVLYEGTDVAPIKRSDYGVGRCLQVGEIRERLGLPRPKYTGGNTNALIHGILGYLKDDGYAEHYVYHGWQITNEGVSLIK